jgi:probable addiction module antidote protein
MVTLSRFNILEHLDSEEEISGYFEAALQDIEEGECGADFFFVCMADTAKARAVNQLAKKTGMDRKELCAMFLDGGEGQDAPLLAPEVAARAAKAFIAPAHAGA